MIKDISCLSTISQLGDHPINKGSGLELSEGLGLGLLTSLLEQPDTSSRNSIIAWMPIQEATSARDAHQKLLYHFKVAIETVLQEQPIHYERTNGNS